MLRRRRMVERIEIETTGVDMNESAQEQTPDQTDIDAVLNRYLDLQKQEQQIREEKAELQQALAAHMKDIGKEMWYPEVDGGTLKVRCRASVSIDYDEELLRQRLTDRYPSILAPNLKKMRRCMNDVEPLLTPMLGRIGSPVPEKIRDAIESGIVQKEEFAGAFEKTIKDSVSVARVRKGT